MTSILVIEDEAIIRDNIATVLRFEDYEVYQAENGQVGVELARQHLPDLIICDVMMPELDGYGVLETLRDDPDTTMIPFIFLTARVEKADMRRGMHLGADDYLTKPFSQQELLDAVSSRLKRLEGLKKGYGATLEEARKKLTRLVAHELRTPLISISMVQDIIGRQIGNLAEEELADMINMMGTGTRRMSHIIEQMVFSTQLESGSLTADAIENEGMPMPLQKIVGDAITLSQRFIPEDNNVNIKTEAIDPTIMINCDFFSLKHAFGELITNAVNFSPNGGTVTIKSRTKDNRSYTRISDKGVGIPSDQIPHALNAYSQVNREKSEQQGMGMGLYLAQQILQAHNGSLILESSVGKGTNVTINLPITSQ